MKSINSYINRNSRFIILAALALATLGGLLLYRLGSLTGGLNAIELQTATTTYGWHSLYQQPLYLPLNLLRSIIYSLASNHSQLIIRLPNAIIGAMTVIVFAWLIRMWHGTRTAILGTILFATAAWILHASRLASYDVLYLLLLPALLLSVAAMQRHSNKATVFYGSLLLWGALLYIPGAIWLVALTMFWERKAIKRGWQTFNGWRQHLMYVISGLLWTPLIAIFISKPSILREWLGLPAHLSSPLNLAKQLKDVFIHLFYHGPSNTAIWLDRAPLLDIFTLVMVMLGIYFYVLHWRVGRSRILLSYFLLGTVLVSLGGAVSLSTLIPLLYICAATGIAYLLHEWLQVFPVNPFARTLGIGLVVSVISLSCLYNMRAYFVAWPHNTTTESSYRTRLR